MPSHSLDVVDLLVTVDFGVRVVDAFYVLEDGIVVLHGGKGSIISLFCLGM